MSIEEQRALMARLPRTWPVFFARHGSFTHAQRAAIPPLLAGEHLLLSAPTASGKTAAVLAPLVERHCPAARPPRRLRILYLVPTRALVNDLRARLEHPLATLGVSLGVKTGDGGFARGRPPDVLLTTPESLDALLASNARLFAGLRALVIDELHGFDGTPRGDQLRALLARVRRVRAYAAAAGHAPDAALQLAALSATLPDAEGAAARFLGQARVVRLGGGRAIAEELLAMGTESEAQLHAYLGSFRGRGWRKALAFCNSRAEVEQYAAAVRATGSFGGAVFTHYSNLEPQRRREIELAFSAAEAAICFTSSTLELGIDIGAIDVSLLIGPPGSSTSFAQRMGRANRRGGAVNVACCYRTPLERLLFQTLLEPPEDSALPSATPAFRPSVAVQQIFSLLKQSPTAALRPAELTELFAGLLSAGELTTICGELAQRGYLAVGRPGEWRPGPRLNALYDEQATSQVGLSIHSNIQTSAGPTLAIRDQHSGRIVARVDRRWLDHEALTLEGRPVRVEWSDGEALWISERKVAAATHPPLYRSGRQLLSLELAALLPRQLGLADAEAPLLVTARGYWWFHWLGDLYGQAALDLLRYTVPATPSAAVGLALLLPDPLQAPPAWSEEQVTRYLRDRYRSYEPLLDLGAFHHLLPPALRRSAVIAAFDVQRFLVAMARLRPVIAPESLVAGLGRLVGDDSSP
jgi:ATP-dependent Lhr-like helicase